MKKIILSVAAVMAFGLAANAQEIKFGVKAGVNFATLTGDDVEDASGRTGLHVGGLVEIKLTDKFSVQPELLYSMQGVQEDYRETGSFGGVSYVEIAEQTMRLNYITVPVMAKYYIIPGLSVEAGPQISFLVKAELEEEYTYSETAGGITDTETGNITVDIKDRVKGVDFGFNIGAGYELPMGLFFQGRYNLGLSKIGESYTDMFGDEFRAADVRNSVIQLSVGWKF